MKPNQPEPTYDGIAKEVILDNNPVKKIFEMNT